jgi:hypothetical protein
MGEADAGSGFVVVRLAERGKEVTHVHAAKRRLDNWRVYLPYL